MTDHADTMAWIWQRLTESDRIGICSHAYPDGDAIGSQLALAELLWAQGKEVILMNRHNVPENLRFLKNWEAVQVVESVPAGLDVLVFIECTEPRRADLTGWEQCPLWVNIDHHVCNTRYAHLNWVAPEAPCVGTMLYELQQRLGLPAPPAFYEDIYVALISDTANFQYNLKPNTFRWAYELVQQGVSAEELARRVFGQYPERRWRLLRMALDTLQLSMDGRIALMTVTHSMLQAVDARYEDTEGFVDYALKTQGVQVAALLKEIEPSHFRVSLRANGRIDLLPLAQRFGGGGHARAAALVLQGPWEEVQARVLAALEGLLKGE
ncbi:MAG: DHH family phosphoesterase [Acidobacteria bacterium]|nr:DHH family phosphoesterase [Acidobacteriota bacterium]MDW7984356.1 DHH family phosphoesterase [Acidobacteriota bacterium]